MFGYHSVNKFIGTHAAVALMLFNASAVAFNPQPEPPGDLWRIEGFINLTTQEINPSGEAVPFGVDAAIAGDEIVDFQVGIIALFSAPDNTGDGKPDDGLYSPVLEYFRVQIGDTSWDETMPATELVFQLQRGSVIGLQGTLTDTMPAHPDLEFLLPTSPGLWIAIDERDGVDLGKIVGAYSLLDGEVTTRPQLTVVDGFVKLDAVPGTAPAAADCILQDHYGRMTFDASSGLLYICSQSGWISK